MTKKNNELPPGVRYKPLADGTPSYQVTVCLRRDGLGKQERRYRTFTPPEGMGKREVRKELERIRSELLNERINTNSLEAGQTLGKSMREQGIMPDILVDMVGVGEETGELAQTLDTVALFYDAELEEATKSALAKLEPAMLIFIAIFAGYIVIAIYTGMFSMYSHM